MTSDQGSRALLCDVCRAATTMQSLSWQEDPQLVVFAHRCHDCGFVRIEGNDWAYDELGYSEDSTSGPRVGTPERPGREFYMASLGLELVGRSAVDVLVLGAGLSYDWQHIGQLETVNDVFVSDFDNLTGAPNFVPIGDDSRTYDVIVACEVIEHIRNPLDDLASVFDLISPNGVFIGSTNIYDGTPMHRHWYPFNPGHVAYHTGESLRRVAASRGASVDFRVPLVATQRAGRRKRYVIVTRDQRVLTNTSAWFARHPYAPSEDDRRAFAPQGA